MASALCSKALAPAMHLRHAFPAAAAVAGHSRHFSFKKVPVPPMKLNRSELYVPGTQVKLIPKAGQSAADVVTMDLEDSVAPAEKPTARVNVIKALKETDFGNKTVCVRINSCDSSFQYRDIVDIIEQAGERLDMFILPMVGTPEDVYAVDCFTTQVENAVGRKKKIGFGIIIETALGMSNVNAIAAASPRNESMHFGVADYSASTKARTTNIGGPNANYGVLVDKDASNPDAKRDYFWGDVWHHPIASLVVACRANGLRPIDGPFGDISDIDGYKAQCWRAAVLGCEGKWAIHPSQITAANEVYSPGEAEVDKAKRILAAMEQADREGKGAVQVDGKMVDIASIKQAQAVVDKAKACGLV